MQNDDRGWSYICRNMKHGFGATLKKIFVNEKFSPEDLEDIFQDTCMVLIRRVKNGEFTVREGSSLFSYLVQIGKLTTLSFLRKNRRMSPLTPFEDKDGEVEKGGFDTIDTEEEKQQAQDEFLDRVFDSIPPECQDMFKLFYWDHKSMEEIAGILGMKNADSAKTKKTRCMTKFKSIGKALLGEDEFPEELIRAAAERAALREILGSERVYAEAGVKFAAFDVDEHSDETK